MVPLVPPAQAASPAAARQHHRCGRGSWLGVQAARHRHQRRRVTPGLQAAACTRLQPADMQSRTCSHCAQPPRVCSLHAHASTAAAAHVVGSSIRHGLDMVSRRRLLRSEPPGMVCMHVPSRGHDSARNFARVQIGERRLLRRGPERVSAHS
jgi:hypothetical protein